MPFYKLEATHRRIPTRQQTRPGRKTYKFYFRSYESMALRLHDSLLRKAKVTVKQCSEAEYIRAERSI